MGYCFSCCRRKKQDKQVVVERQPLLRSDTDALQHPQTRTHYEKVTDVLAALHAGKLPSQQQIDALLRKLLRSGMLDVDSGGNGSALNESARKVIRDARYVVEVLMQVGLEKNDDNRGQDLLYQLHELSSKGLPVEIKAPGDVQVSSERADKVQTAASAIPSQNELASDTIAFISSLRTLATLLLTSSAFRLFVGDLLSTFREMVANTAVQVRQAAETVEHVSEAIEANVRRVSKSAGIQPVTEVQKNPETNPRPDAGQVGSAKEAVLDRIEDIFSRAQASPKYNSALRTLLFLFRKYAERVSLASIAISEATQPSSGEPPVQLIAPVIVPDPRFIRVLENLMILLERFANGKSLDPVLRSLFETVHDISLVRAGGDSNEGQIFFREVGAWLDTALANSTFVNSRAGRENASRLYEKGSDLLSQDTRLSKNVQHLLDEANLFAEAIQSDRSTNKLFKAIDILHSDALSLLGKTAEDSKRAITRWRTTLLRTALGWMLPRLLCAIRVLPMPRFEFISLSSNGTRIEAAIDALLLSAEGALVPDLLSVQEFAELRVEVDEDVGAMGLTNPNSRLILRSRNENQGGLQGDFRNYSPIGGIDDTGSSSAAPKGKRTNVMAASRVRIHVEGLRVAAHDVGYYASYAWNSWLGYMDEGLLSLEVGRGRHRQGDGLLLDIELEIDSDSKPHDHGGMADTNNESDRLFRIVEVRSAIPGLTLRIGHSRHWILNSLLAPLAGPIGRIVAPRVLNAQIRLALESLEKLLREVKINADEKAENRARKQKERVKTEASDWWGVLLEKFGSDNHEDEEEDEEEQEVYTDTHTQANLTGITRTTIEQPEPEPQNEAPPPTENALAVGLGAQLLPGKAEPSALGIERESPQEADQELAAAEREAIQDVQGKLLDVQEGVKGVGRKSIEEAVRVRQMAESARERMEHQERREHRRGGWRSRVFDL